MDQLAVSVLLTWRIIRFDLYLINAKFDSSYNGSLPSFHKMPEFLQNNDYKPPTNSANGIFQDAKGYKGDLFHYYAEHPREGNSFNQLMDGIMALQASRLDVIPADSFLNGSDPNLPLLVDIGGNIGHYIENFRQVYPDTAARLYLQDLPGVIANSKCPEPVNKMAHEFSRHSLSKVCISL